VGDGLDSARRRLLARLFDEEALAAPPEERFRALLDDPAPAAAPPEPLEGVVVAERYRIVRELGRGAMSTVYLVRDLAAERQLALKALDPARARGVTIARFQREIELLSRLSHPGILPLLDVGESEGTPFFVMPYIEGGTLRERLTRERSLRAGEACRIAAAVAEALQHAHERGVIHRDMKPENVLLDGDRALVADFGIARAVERASRAVRLTAIGVLLGTPSYMSPEQTTGEGADERSDVFSLGRVLHEMLGGAPPATSDPLELLVERRQGVNVTAELPTTVPPTVAAVVQRALETEPAERFGSAGEMAMALREVLLALGDQ
jgi:serine/threonine protein kinase